MTKENYELMKLAEKVSQDSVYIGARIRGRSDKS